MSSPSPLNDKILRLRGLSRNVARSKDMALALHHGIPIVFTETNYVAKANIVSLDEDLMVACGDFTPMDISITNFCSLTARYFIAECLANYAVLRGNKMNMDQRLAFIMANLIGMAMERPDKGLLEVTKARTKIIEKLRVSPPSLTVVMQGISDIIRDCQANQTNMCVPKSQAEEVILDDVPEDGMVIQKYQFYASFGHLIPSSLFTTVAARTIWNELSKVSKEFYKFADNSWDGVIDPETWNTKWAELPTECIIGIFNMLGCQHRVQATNAMYAAKFAYITTVAKANVTEAWINRRANMLNVTGSKLDMSMYTKVSIFNDFHQLVNTTISNPEKFYEKIIALMTLATRANMPAFKWILEQSALANITHATVIANVCKKMAYFDIDVLIDSGIPDGNVRKFLELVLEVLRCPFRSLHEVPVKVGEYSDLAYLCLYISRNIMNETSLKNYAGNTANNCILARATLEAIAVNYCEVLNQFATKDISVEHMLNKHHIAGEAKIVAIGDGYYTVGGEVRYGLGQIQARRLCIDAGKKIMENTGHVNDAIHSLGPLGPIDPNEALLDQTDAGTSQDGQPPRPVLPVGNLGHDRTNWARNAKNLPPHSRKLTDDQITSRLKGGLTHRSFAFKELCGALALAAFQTEYSLIDFDSVNAPSPYRQITEDQAAFFALWGVTVPPEYRQRIPAYVGNKAIQEAELSSRYFVIPSITVNNAPIVPPDHDGSDLPVIPGTSLEKTKKTKKP
ncbi:MAG: hypothetical protein [Bat faecal associated chuvirus 3]|nr:MAG: hypothetical protein [Bat faecal associated chuvirus 3]